MTSKFSIHPFIVIVLCLFAYLGFLDYMHAASLNTFDKYRALDESGKEITCSDLMGLTQQLDKVELFEIDPLEDVIDYQYRSGYKFHQCANLIQKESEKVCDTLVSALDRVARRADSYSTYWSGIENDKAVCEEEWTEHTKSFNSVVAISKEKGTINIPLYDADINPSHISELRLKHVPYGDYWALDIYLYDTQRPRYTLVYSDRNQADTVRNAILNAI